MVEAIFDWPGIGSYTVQAILTADYKVMLAVTLLVGVDLRRRQHPGRRGAWAARSAADGSRGEMLVLRKFAQDVPAVLGLGIVLFVAAGRAASARGWRPIRRTPRPRICCAA